MLKIMMIMIGSLGLLLSSCSLNHSQSCHGAYQQIKQEKMTEWSMRGRVSWLQPGKMSQSASFVWQQKDERDFTMRFFGPLGTSGLQLSRTGQHVTGWDGHHRLVAKSVQALLAQQLGMHFPVEHLMYWVRGLTAHTPGERVVMDHRGRMTRLSAAYYTVDFLDYRCVQGQWTLPARLTLTWKGNVVNLVINHWTVNTAA